MAESDTEEAEKKISSAKEHNNTSSVTQNNSNYAAIDNLSFQIELGTKLPDLIKIQKQILSNPRNLFAYQQYSAQRKPEQTTHAIKALFQNFRIDLSVLTHTNAFVLTLMCLLKQECPLLMYACFSPRQGYSEAMVDTFLTLELSREIVKKMAEDLNRLGTSLYGPVARVGHSKNIQTNNPRNEPITLHVTELIIASDVLNEGGFLLIELKRQLESMQEIAPLLMEKWRMDSKMQTICSVQVSQQLRNIAHKIWKFNCSEFSFLLGYSFLSDKMMRQYTNEFEELSNILEDPRSALSQRKTSAHKCINKFSFFISSLCESDQSSFITSKKEIEENLKHLGL